MYEAPGKEPENQDKKMMAVQSVDSRHTKIP